MALHVRCRIHLSLWDQLSIVMHTDDLQILLCCCRVVAVCFLPCLEFKFIAEEIKFVNNNSGN